MNNTGNEWSSLERPGPYSEGPVTGWRTPQRPRRRLVFLANMLRPDRPKLNLTLFVLTFLTTWFVGYESEGNVLLGLAYSLTIMSILTAHEMGHYLMCRRHNVKATLPFFTPVPLPPFGTMGAIIRMDDRMPNRRALFDIGVAGPIAGLLVTLPAIYFGLRFSKLVSLQPSEQGVYFLGESVLFKFITRVAIGQVPEGYDVLLHPVAFAGWAGLFVTALNLLPIGQLDGGHVLYAMFGRKSNLVYKVVLGAFIAVCVLVYWGWLLLVLFLIFIGYRHPAPLDDFTPLDRRRQIVGFAILVVFALSFTPAPFKVA